MEGDSRLFPNQDGTLLAIRAAKVEGLSMNGRLPSRRTIIAAGVAGGLGAAILRSFPARAATRIRFQLNWYAEAEHGGYYQAQATGLYDRAGLDVQLMQGGPQLSTAQLLAGGEADMAVGYDLQVLSGVEKDIPLRMIAAPFQIDLQGLLTRPDVSSFSELKGHRIFVTGSGYSSYWPWLKQKFGYTDDMAATKSAGLQTFIADPTSAAAGYVTAEPFVALQQGVKTNFLLYSNQGWPTYTNPVMASEDFLAHNDALIRPFLRATMEGWKSYLADPAPGNALIKQANPKMDDAQIAFSLQKLREIGTVAGGDAGRLGIGAMTEDRWRETRNFMVSAHLLKPETNWRKAFTTKYMDDVHVLP